jgi:hypothetical protein
MAYVAMTPSEEKENLEKTLVMLNDNSPRLNDWQGKNWGYDDAVRMRRMVRAWIAAGSAEEGRNLLRIKLEPNDRQLLEKFTQRISVTTEPNGRLLVIDFYGPDTAAMNFTRLIRNSQQWRLREPCLTCHDWYIAKTNREERDYCSRKCAGNAVSARKRKREHDRRIEKARMAIQNYLVRPIRVSNDWKQYVSRTTKISKRFLTIAVRKGELVQPELQSASLR